MPRLVLLFLCTGNACRSQMAEGWARHLHGEKLDALSAGTHPAGIDPRAVIVMAESGVEIGGQRCEHLQVHAGRRIDLLVTVCDRAQEACPVHPSAARALHHGFPDPPALAAEAESEEEALEHYRRVRDEIRDFVSGLPACFENLTDPDREER